MLTAAISGDPVASHRRVWTGVRVEHVARTGNAPFAKSVRCRRELAGDASVTIVCGQEPVCVVRVRRALVQHVRPTLLHRSQLHRDERGRRRDTSRRSRRNVIGAARLDRQPRRRRQSVRVGNHEHRVVDVDGKLIWFVVAHGDQIDMHVAEVNAVATAGCAVLEQNRNWSVGSPVLGPGHRVEVVGDPVGRRETNHHREPADDRMATD